MLKLYGGPTFNAVKIVLTAEEAGLEYEYVPVNMMEGAHKTPEFIARHPLGKVPAIEHDGKALFESGAICRYLAQLGSGDLYSGDLYQKAIIDQWVDMMSCHAGRWLGAVFFNEFVKPALLDMEPDAAIIAEACSFLEDQLPVIDQQLGRNAFLAGEALTIADLFAFSYFQTTEQTSIDLSPYANLAAWYETIKARPSVAKTNGLIHG